MLVQVPEVRAGVVLNMRTQVREFKLGKRTQAYVSLTWGDTVQGVGYGEGETGRIARDQAMLDAYLRFPGLFEGAA